MALTKLTRGEVNEEIAAALHKDLSVSDDALDVTRYRKNALAFLEAAYPWWFLRAYQEAVALTAGTWQIALPADFSRIDRASICYYGSNADSDNNLIFYEDVTEIDRREGRGWKRSGYSGGTPHYASLMAEYLVIAPAPSTSFVSSYPHLDYWYFKTIEVDYATVRVAASNSAADDTTALNATTVMLPYISWAAQQLGQLQEDNNAFSVIMSRWRTEILPEIRGMDPSVTGYEPVARPRIGRPRRRLGRIY